MEIIKKLILWALLIVISLIIGISTLESGILLSIISFIVIILFVKKVNIKRFSLFLIAFSFITKVIVALILNVPMTPDYETMYNASLNVLNGNFSFIREPYFTSYAYQIPHVFYQALILKIVNSIIALKVMNCVFSTAITYLIYLIVRKFTKEDIARITSLVYAVALYPMYLNSIFGNQQLGLLLFLIGIYILLTKKSTILNGVIIGILFALGNLERPEGIVYIATLVIYNIITVKGIKGIVKAIAPVLVVYFAIGQAASMLMIKTGVNDIGFGNSDPYWKFLLGFNYEYNGKNNLEDYAFTYDLEVEKKEVFNRLKQVNRMPKLFYNKTKIMWLYDDLENSFNAVTSTQFSQDIIDIGVNYIKVMNLLVLILIPIGFIKNKKFDKGYYFFICNVGIYFVVYTLIEVCARYYYCPFVSIIILSSLGMERLLEYISSKFKIKLLK